ncbi:MAG: hypothetical protein JF601_10680, partial [Acidobacteria bacterium]|nr:hypothetical protein [Acidobacteriota bacterium]
MRGVRRFTRWRPNADYCSDRIRRLLRFIIEPGARVLNIGQCDSAVPCPPARFDYIVVDDLSDTVNLAEVITRLVALCEPHTRVVVCGYATVARRSPAQDDVRDLLQAAGFHIVGTHRLVLLPVRIPVVSDVVNRIAACLPFVSKLCLVSVVVARPKPKAVCADSVSVSVVVPCRNERGNVAAAV